MEDGATGLGSIFDQLADDTKHMVAVGVKTINQEDGQGLSQYNAKVQDFADRVPGDLGKKGARYPWVTITMSLAYGLMLGIYYSNLAGSPPDSSRLAKTAVLRRVEPFFLLNRSCEGRRPFA